VANPVEYVPEMQLRHMLDTFTPVPVWYFPAEQASQLMPDQPFGGEICPLSRGVVEFHPPSPVKPALHLQLSWAWLPV
jgi:hypothetical protein